MNPLLGPFPRPRVSVYPAVVGLAGVYELCFAYQLYTARTAPRPPEPEREHGTAE